jgi:hydrogenase maturation protease
VTDQDIDRLVDAVLHEGYLLYPYRPAVKNHRRWTFGGLFPQVYSSKSDSNQSCELRADVLLEAPPTARLLASLRFLRIEERTVGKAPARVPPEWESVEYPRVDSLEVLGVRYVPWQEGLQREFRLEPRPLRDLQGSSVCQLFLSPADRRRTLLRDAELRVVGDLVRSTAGLCALLKLSVQPLGRGVHRVILTAANRSRMSDPQDAKEAERAAFMSTHVLLRTDAGRFLSQTDPPAEWADQTRASRNVGTWPVLVGDPGEATTVLGSPMILPDHPQIAPESSGDLFDGTEIEEILSLRIETLSPAEKQEMMTLDPRVRHLLARTESLDRRQRSALHGTWRRSSEVPHAR